MILILYNDSNIFNMSLKIHLKINRIMFHFIIDYEVPYIFKIYIDMNEIYSMINDPKRTKSLNKRLIRKKIVSLR